jgi:hypothetical protein
MNQRELGDYSVKKILRNLYSYIYALFSFGGIALGLFLWFFPRIFFPLFSGFSRGG